MARMKKLEFAADTDQRVVGVDPGKTTAMVLVRGRRVESVRFVATDGPLLAMCAAIADALAELSPERVVCEIQLQRGGRMPAIEAVVSAICHERGIPLVRHCPRAFHRGLGYPGGHRANKRHSVALARRVLGAAAFDAFLDWAPTSRVHDLCEAFLFAFNVARPRGIAARADGHGA